MAAPTALDSARTGTPDGTGGVPIPTVLMQQNAAFEAPCGIALSDRLPDQPTADRAVTASDTATDMSTAAFAGTAGANLSAINNRGALMVWVTFAATTDRATVRLVYYDSLNNPQFVGPALEFVPLAGFRSTATGVYLSTPQVVESYGASKVRPYIVSKGDAVSALNVFAQPI